MQQKFKFLYFAIVAASCIFLVPSTSDARGNWKATQTPGETVGKHIDLPPMKIDANLRCNKGTVIVPCEDVDFVMSCRNMMVDTSMLKRRPAYGQPR